MNTNEFELTENNLEFYVTEMTSDFDMSLGCQENIESDIIVSLT